MKYRTLNISRMRKLIVLLLIFITIVNSNTYAQEEELQGIDPIINNIIPSSPEAAAFEKYVDMPVSYYTGVPNISIPIANLKGKYISVPVSLSYHASGIKVEETAGWVGLGWSLNAGGTIMRTKKGILDEQTSGNYAYDNLLPDPNFDYSIFSAWKPDFNTRMSVINGHTDTQPDEFTFNFMGHSGKFYIYKDEVFTIPRQNIKIEKTQTDNILYNGDFLIGITQFIITTDDGIVFTFGKNSNNIAYEITSSLNQFSDITSNYVSSWFLMEINAHGEKFTFNYENRTEILDSKKSLTVSYFKSSVGPSSHPKTDDYSPPVIVDTEISTQKLLSVVSDHYGRIDFLSTVDREDCNGSTLNEISIKNKEGVEIKSFEFKYGYYNENSNQLSKRLKLLSLTEYSSDRQENKSHFFQYDGHSLPPRNSCDKDHWGYYNAKGNSTLLPEFFDPTHQTLHPGADKSANPNVQEYGILKKIIYPTGGCVKFEYEANDYGFLNYTPEEKPVSVTHVLTNSLGCTDATNECLEPKTQSYIIVKSAKDQMVNVNAVFENGIPTEPMNINVTINGQSVENGSGLVFLNEGINNMTIFTDARNKATVTITYDMQIGTTTKTPSSGLRIKSVKHYDKGDNIPKLTKEYSYTVEDNPNRSSGVMLGRPPGYYRISKKTIVDGSPSGPNGSPPSVIGYYDYYTINSDNIFELSLSQGKHIVYKEVKEKVISDNETGYNVYKYTLAADEGTFVFPYTPLISNDWKRGLLKEKAVYDNTGNLKVKENNEYKFYNSSSDPYVNYIPGGNVGLVCQGTYYNEVETAVEIYNYKTSWFHLDKKITETYFDGNSEPKVDTTFYNYDNPEHMLLTEQITKIPGQNDIHTKFTYPPDYSYTDCDILYDTKKAEYDNLVQAAINGYYQCKNINEAACWDEFYSCNSTYQLERLENADGCLGRGLLPPYEEYTPELQNSVNLYLNNYDEGIPIPSDLQDNVEDLLSELRQIINELELYCPIYGSFCPLILEDCEAEADCYGIYSSLLPDKSMYITPFRNCLTDNASNSPSDVSAVINMRLKGLYPNLIEKSIWEKNSLGNLELLSGNFNKYDQYQTNLFLPIEVFTTENQNPLPENNFNPSNTTVNNFIFDDSYVIKGEIEYSIKGNIIEYIKENDIPVSILWAYDYTYPIAKIENKTFHQTQLKLMDLGSGIEDINNISINNSNDETELINFFNSLREEMPDALITSYTYNPQIGITGVTDPNGKTTRYEYDNFNRLKLIRDNDNNIINHTEYNYHNYAYPIPSEKEFGLNGGTFDFEIYAQGDWTIIEKPNWISLSPITGNDNALITGNCQSSTTERDGVIKIQCGEEISELSVGQVAYIYINPYGLAFMNSTSETQTIAIGASGYHWELSSNSSWISFTPESNNYMQDVIVRCTTLNPLYESRTGIVTVTASNEQGQIVETGSFSVTQDEAEMPPGISGHVYDKWGFPIEGVEMYVFDQIITTTNSNGYYFILIEGGEMDVSPVLAGHIFTPEVPKTYLTSEIINGIENENYYSNQEITPLELTVFPDLLYFTQGGTLSKSLAINCNVDYQLVSNSSWITISNGHLGMHTVTCDAPINESREANVTVYLTGSNYTLDIPVIQEGTCTGDCGSGCTWDPVDCRCEDENGNPDNCGQ